MDRRLLIKIGAALLAVVLLAIAIGSAAPGGFPANAVVDIKSGMTLKEAADQLKTDGIIRSTLIFRAYVKLFDGSTGVKTGEYLFDKPESALRVAFRLAKGEEGFPLVKVTIPEGSDSADMARIIARAVSGFDSSDFLTQAKQYEGYLFPDTYFWPTNLTAAKAISDMKATFDDKLAAIGSDLASSGEPVSDVIKLASIVEKEATSTSDRKIVAGILWKRLKIGMALQVDPPFAYILDKPLDKLTLADLKTDSPYNLYLHVGLPPTPIDSPGLDAILATLHPTATPYLYYISGKDGAMHYASTLEGHNANIAKYLN